MNDTRNLFLYTASNLGRQLCSSAYWADSHCNWIGRSFSENGLIPPSSKALGPDIYDGTSGIALFLGNLYTYTYSDNHYATAKGAIKHALSHADQIHSINRFGFYAGIVGIAYVSMKLGIIFKEDELVQEAISAIRKISLDLRTTHLLDIISGNAGAIPAILEMHSFYKEENLLDLALYLGDELLSSATKGLYGWSWNHEANGIETPNNLTGFSHGAAGIGNSLLDLFEKTDIKAYGEAAKQAFNYENYWYSSAYVNWPDFRETHNPTEGEYNYASSWCHGAPGIGLSRLHAYRVFGEEFINESRAAIKTTLQSVKDRNTFGINNYCLCHGLGGNSDILLYASIVLGDTSYRSVASEIGRYGIQKYGNTGLSWPCGIGEGITPGLMVGIAGIGYYYLRLYDPQEIRSILLISS